MRAIIHCHRCKSRTIFGTDGRGGLTERLSHVCKCPPIKYAAEREAGGQGALPALPKVKQRDRKCVDCGAPVSKYATRCREHSEIRRRKLTTAAQRTKRLQKRLSA